MNFKRLKFVLLVAVSLSCVLMLSGCSTTVYGEKFEGINVIWTPFVAVLKWLFKVFTPHFWSFIGLLWEMPNGVRWVALVICYLLGGVLYLFIVAIILLVDLVLAVLLAVIWFIAAILNGIFKWY